MRKNFFSFGKRRPASVMFLILSLALWAGGCGRGNRHIPSVGSARQALETALKAWQNGQPVGTIAAASPPVQAVDSGWGKGQRLSSYEILEEATREDGKRRFKVRLHLQKPGNDQEVHYVVVGQSPLWVYREEDYQKAEGWGG